MKFFPDYKTFLEISIGSFHMTIVWYAILILGGAILAFYLSQRVARKMGYEKELLEDYFFTMFPIAIIGARLYYCLFEWAAYADNPIRIFYIWEGGLAIHGGLIAGVLYSFFYFYRKGVNLLRIGDCIMPNVLLAQAIGRWGNFMNQEAFGQIVNEEYFNYFPAFIKEHMYIDGAYRQPMFLYESIANLVGFLLITLVYRKHGRNRRGDMVFAYVTWYGMVRFWIESFRSDSLMFMGLKVAQLISIAFIIIGILGFLGVYHKVFRKWYPFKPEKPLLLFDADGTLIDTEALIYDSFRHTFKEYRPDYELSEEELHSFLGPTLRDTFVKYFSEEQADELVAHYRAYNHEHHDEMVTGMPYAKETIQWLHEQGYTMGIVSNKIADLVRRGLVCAEIEEYMDVVIGCDGVSKPKPNPEALIMACKQLHYPVDDVIYVGDAPSDILAARNMGIYSIGYVNSERTRARLEKVKPCRMIEDLRELKTIVKEDREWNEFVI